MYDMYIKQRLKIKCRVLDDNCKIQICIKNQENKNILVYFNLIFRNNVINNTF